MSKLTFYGAIFTIALCGAVPAKAGDDTILGTGIGAALGGLFGSQLGHGTSNLVATGMGVAVGGLVGNSIGHTMDEENSRSVGSGTATSTSIYSDPSPIAYNSYAPNYVAPPTPPPIYVNQQSGAYCREYSQEIRIDGQIQESYGTACLQPDGSWRVVQ